MLAIDSMTDRHMRRNEGEGGGGYQNTPPKVDCWSDSMEIKEIGRTIT